MKPIFVELFSGSGTVSKVARACGFETVTVDIEPRYKPDICIDILNLRRSQLPRSVAIVWASPPCTAFSLLQSHRHFTSHRTGYRRYYHEPTDEAGRSALQVLRATGRLIVMMEPQFYFIENPRGILRHRPEMVFVPYRKTVRYSDYGMEYEKPTDIFTNCKYFQPHTSRRPVGLKHVTDLPNAHERAIIPAELAKAVIDSCLPHMPRTILTPEFPFQ